mgnify:CR=1 FL=1
MTIEPEHSQRTKRPRRSKAQIDAILQDFQSSGLSQVEFARRNSIAVESLRQWIYRRRAKAGDASEGGFVPVSLKSGMDPDCVVVRYAAGHEVSLPLSMGAGNLAQLLAILLKSC